MYNGLRILGLGGCRKYHPGPHQYTDNQMRGRIRRLRAQIRRLGGIDVVVSHAPAEGLGDADDVAHWGFEALRELLDKYHPAYHVHGHVHMTYGNQVPRVRDYNGTTIVNAYERYVLDIPDREVPFKKRDRLIWASRPMVFFGKER